MPQSLRFEFDRDYGIDRRTGWTVCVNGIVVVQLTTFWTAIRALFREWRKGFRCGGSF